MKKLLSILIVILFALQGWAATYYVMPSGALNYSQKAAATACTNATAMNVTAINHASVNFTAGDIIDGCNQTYTNGIVPADVGESGNPIIYQNFIITKVGGYGIDVNGKSYITFRYIDVNGSMFYVHGTSAGITAYYTQIRNCTDNYGVYVSDSSAMEIYNCIIASNKKAGIYSVSPATVTAWNNLIIGNSSTAGEASGGLKATGTLNADYNIVTGNGQYPTWNFIATGITDGGHNIKQSLPQTTSTKTKKALFVLTSDDQNIAYWESLATALSPYNVKFTMFLYIVGLSAGNITSLQTLSAAGHDIGVHARTHTDLTKTYPFTITTSNDDATCEVNTTLNTITLSTTTPGNSVTVDWSVTDKTTADLKTSVSGKGWTITTNTNVSDHVSLQSLASTGGAQAIGAGYAPLFDQTAYWTDQIMAAKTWITDNIGITPTVTAQPFGATSEALRIYYRDVAGFAGARGVGFPSYLSSVNIYNIGAYIAQYSLMVPSDTESTVRKYARGIYHYSVENGQIAVFLVHKETEMTASQVAWLVDEIQQCGGTWILFKDLITDVKADHATADGYLYTKTYTDQSNYHLLSGSPAINAGVAIDGLTTDADGKPIIGLPDIGAYEYQPTGIPAGLFMGRRHKHMIQ